MPTRRLRDASARNPGPFETQGDFAIRFLLTLLLGVLLTSPAQAEDQEITGEGVPYTLHLTVSPGKAHVRPVNGTLRDDLENVTCTVRGSARLPLNVKARVFLGEQEVGTIDGRYEGSELVFRFRGVRIVSASSFWTIRGTWYSTRQGRQTMIEVLEGVDGRYVAEIRGRTYRVTQNGTSFVFELPIRSPQDIDFTGAYGEILPEGVQKALASRGIAVR